MSIFCAIPVISSLLTACQPPLPYATGYVEGEYVLLAPVQIAQINSIKVRRGSQVKPGQALVLLERRDAEIAVAQTRAALAQAVSRLSNLKRGRRPEEIAVIEATLASARAKAAEAKRELDRQRDLFSRGIIAQTQLDAAVTAYDVARAHVGELEANLKVARLPARADEIKAAEAAVAQARAALEQAEWRLSKRSLSVNFNGQVFDIIRQPGEVSGPQAPVLSLLPDGAVKLRLYVSEKVVSQIGIGTHLDVKCDGCPDNLSAKVTYISNAPEFTPPVIYSLENRQKLVYLIEARPDANARMLKPGQIVNVDLKALK
ncbi:MAG: HlyD family efflux transporter periplasmic adaptor subunit [Paracoccaceae bacterium]|nr:HlyD family efflux transporter periplasmic adaptor subunit [Paracoccaceae bacterium]